MKPRRIAAALPARTKAGEALACDWRNRLVLSAAVAFACNLLYALYHCVLGIVNLSLWFIAMCAFYGILATMRFSAVLCARRNREAPSADAEGLVMRMSGALLAILSLVLAAVSYISISQDVATKYDEIVMITIATYVFYKLSTAIVLAARQRGGPSPLLRTIRSIRYAEAAASMLTLQRSMLASFGAMDGNRIHRMNALTGAGVCLFVLALGICLMIRPIRKENERWQSQKS